MNIDPTSTRLEEILQGLVRHAATGLPLNEVIVAQLLLELQPILAQGKPAPADAQRLDAFYQLLMAWGSQQERGFSPEFKGLLVDICLRIPATVEACGHLLAVLVSTGSEDDLDAFAQTYVAHPPSDSLAALRPLVALMKQEARASIVFPSLLDAIYIPHVAPGVLDVANCLSRDYGVFPHPAAERLETLIRLLQAIVASLEKISSEQDANTKTSPEQVAEAVSLAISLADTLALIGDPRAIPVLAHLAQLPHRRLRVEGECALVRLGVEEAKERLLKLANEPVVRLYVLKYAEELELANRLDEHVTGADAIAEAKLVTFLAQPAQLGFPPASCELIDTRTLTWPGYEEPRMCFLFRFAFPVPDESGTLQTRTRIGIAGPLVHAFSADLNHLSVPDLFAAFAGYQAEHDEIAEVRLPTSSRDITDRATAFAKDLDSHGLTEIEPAYWGTFFSDDYLVAAAKREDHPGAAVIDRDTVIWLPNNSHSHPLRPEHLVYIYKGRRLLNFFNPEGWN